MLNYRIFVLISALAATSIASAQSFRGCPPDPDDLIFSPRVTDYWDSALPITEDLAILLRDDRYSDNYKVKEKYWDDGFGWRVFYAELNRPFAKIFSAMHLLDTGVSSFDRWSSASTARFGPTYVGEISEPSTPRLVMRDRKAHVFLRNADGEIIHVYYDPYLYADPSLIKVENLHDSVATAMPTVSGEIFIWQSDSSSSLRFRMVGLPNQSVSDSRSIVLFENTVADSWDAWELTADLPDNLLLRNAIAFPLSDDVLSIYGVNQNGQLVWYNWRSDSRAIKAGVITNGPDWTLSADKDSLVAVEGLPGGTSVFAVDEKSGHLVHFHFTGPGLNDLTEDVTEIAANSGFFTSPQLYRVFQQDSPAKHRWSDGDLWVTADIAVARSDRSFVLNLTRDDHHVQKYELQQGCNTSGVCIARRWTSDDINDPGAFTIDYSSILNPSQNAARKGIEVTAELSLGPHGGVFARANRGTDNAGNLIHIHYLRSASFWFKPLIQFTDVGNLATGGDRIKEVNLSHVRKSVIVQGPQGNIHALGTNLEGRLIDYWWSPFFRDWRWTDVHEETFVADPKRLESSKYDPGVGLDFVEANDGDFHVVGINSTGISPQFDARIVHFIHLAASAWHTNYDYSNWANGKKYNHRYEGQRNDSTDAGYAKPRPFKIDRIFMRCRAFQRSATPANIAALMLHEATHLHWDKAYRVWSHSTQNEVKMDKWFPHGVGEIPPNQLLPKDEYRHSMYQIQIEYLSDIAEFAAPNIPYSVIQDAKSRANRHIDANILSSDPAPFRVGEPRP